jgi:hypothetical protein
MIDGLVTKVKRKVELKSRTDIIELHPFGDVHWDTDACERDRFDADLALMKKSKNALFLGMGDYLDFMAWGDRKRVHNAGLHETSLEKLHKLHRDDMRAFSKKIEFMKGKCLGLLDGNHNWVDENGKSGTELLCRSVQAPYLGWLSYIRLNIDVHNSRVSVDIVACHGKGGGKLPGTAINQVEDLHRIFPGADLYICGHNHQRGAWPISCLIATRTARTGDFAIKEKTQWLCRSGSYMRGYQVGCGGFVSGKLMRPSSLGKITIRIGIERHQIGGKPEDSKPKITVEA